MFETSTELFEKSHKHHKVLPKTVLKDGVKWVLIPAKILLDYVGLWPESNNKIFEFFHFINIFIYLFGQIQYIIVNSGNVTNTISCIAITAVTIEVSFMFSY